jgi:hypothetical protein
MQGMISAVNGYSIGGKMKRIFLIALLGSYTAPLAADAQTISGNSLYDTCTSENNVFAGFCIGYIIGLIEGKVLGGLLFTNAAGVELKAQDFNKVGNQLFQHCIPQDATNEQLRDVVVKYLRENPAARHESARFLASESFRGAFPCE